VVAAAAGSGVCFQGSAAGRDGPALVRAAASGSDLAGAFGSDLAGAFGTDSAGASGLGLSGASGSGLADASGSGLADASGSGLADAGFSGGADLVGCKPEAAAAEAAEVVTGTPGGGFSGAAGALAGATPLSPEGDSAPVLSGEFWPCSSDRSRAGGGDAAAGATVILAFSGPGFVPAAP
jgi:hypothetical protein